MFHRFHFRICNHLTVAPFRAIPCHFPVGDVFDEIFTKTIFNADRTLVALSTSHYAFQGCWFQRRIKGFFYDGWFLSVTANHTVWNNMQKSLDGFNTSVRSLPDVIEWKKVGVWGFFFFLSDLWMWAHLSWAEGISAACPFLCQNVIFGLRALCCACQIVQVGVFISTFVVGCIFHHLLFLFFNDQARGDTERGRWCLLRHGSSKLAAACQDGGSSQTDISGDQETRSH